MESWRRNYSNNYNNQNNSQLGSKSSRRPQYRKPPQPHPRGPGYYNSDASAWVRSVPSWERKFISTVGSMPWKRFLDCQFGLGIYKNIFQWDDSAGGEAFRNAKQRFWAEIHGRPCDIHLPDPNMYIDHIDWNAWSDTELYKDLGNKPVITDEEKDVKAETDDTAAAPCVDAPIVATGWDDEELKNEGEGESWDEHPLRSLMKPIIPPDSVVCVDHPDYSPSYPSLPNSGGSQLVTGSLVKRITPGRETLGS